MGNEVELEIDYFKNIMKTDRSNEARRNKKNKNGRAKRREGWAVEMPEVGGFKSFDSSMVKIQMYEGSDLEDY